MQEHIEAMRLATESGDSDAFDVALRAFEDVRVERNRFFHARCVLLSFEQSRASTAQQLHVVRGYPVPRLDASPLATG